ncbi:MAG: endonuclease/exonuclease/phosphatase family protein [Frankia sp.]
MTTAPRSNWPTAIEDLDDQPDSWAHVAVVVATWTVLGGLALIAAGRFSHLDDAIGWPYPAIDALSPLIFLLAYPTVAVGFALRRNLLTIAGATLVVLHLLLVAPEVWPGSAPTAPAGSSGLRLLTANVRFDNPAAGGLGTQIRAQRPDIVVLEELSPTSYGDLSRTGALAGYRYQAVHLDLGAFGSGVFSRYPLTGDTVPRVAGTMMQRVTVTLTASRRFTLYAVHTLAPKTRSTTGRWRTQLQYLRNQAHADERSGAPLVLAGDFNATRDNRPFERVAHTGLRDAHDVAHAGWAPTWSATVALLPTTVRIDHVLVSRRFTVTSYATGSRFGSDHLPVLVGLAMS